MALNPQNKIKQIHDPEERRTVIALMDILEGPFGFNFYLEKGKIIEIQMVSTGLVTIPRQLGDLSALYKLQLQSNHIRRIKNLSRCKSVKILNLSDNRLDSANLTPLEKLDQLQSLNLAHNKISNIDCMNSLTKLESLNFHENQIESIPKWEKLDRLKFLDLSNNKITHLENIHYLENLISLKLENNLLSAEENEIANQSIDKIKEYCRKKENLRKETC